MVEEHSIEWFITLWYFDDLDHSPTVSIKRPKLSPWRKPFLATFRDGVWIGIISGVEVTKKPGCCWKRTNELSLQNIKKFFSEEVDLSSGAFEVKKTLPDGRVIWTD